jgi:L-alanine-DL-glutamate epimerase-like enolase superfamily enzyme
MKITGIETVVLHVPCPKPMSLEFKDHRMVAAFIDTDQGVQGFGYTLAFGGGGAEAIQVYLETRLKPLLIGEDPRLVARLWEKMFRADRGIRRVGLAGYALAALDIALWDLAGVAVAALQALGRGDRSRGLLRQRRLGQVHRERPACRSRTLRGHGLPLLQDEDP